MAAAASGRHRFLRGCLDFLSHFGNRFRCFFSRFGRLGSLFIRRCCLLGFDRLRDLFGLRLLRLGCAEYGWSYGECMWGVPLSVLALLADCGANILTILQSPPIGSRASVVVSMDIENINVTIPEMIKKLSDIRGVENPQLLDVA